MKEKLRQILYNFYGQCENVPKAIEVKQKSDQAIDEILALIVPSINKTTAKIANDLGVELWKVMEIAKNIKQQSKSLSVEEQD